jgi:hypothetical protein
MVALFVAVAILFNVVDSSGSSDVAAHPTSDGANITIRAVESNATIAPTTGT